MFKFFEILRNTKTIIPVLVILVVIIVLLSVIFFSRSTPPSQNTLSAIERQYRNNLPQAFSPGPDGFGTLVVNSNPSEARVIIDGAEDEGGDTSSEVLPINQTPFKAVAIPAGKHTLFIAKTGYEFQELDFEIKADRVTRLDLKLDPIATLPNPTPIPQAEWRSKLPITTPDYNLEYIDDRDFIRATLKIDEPNVEQSQQKAQILYEQINNKLREIGVDLAHEKIEFLIQ